MGTLLAIATRDYSRGPMKLHERAGITQSNGVEDDFRGSSSGRNVVVLTREGWEAACEELGKSPDWTTRRANLFVEGVDLWDQTGRRLRVGDVVLEITGECDPCERMESAVTGLFAALKPRWRAGVTCTVVSEGQVTPGDPVTLEQSPS